MGMSRQTGKPIGEYERIRQSIQHILSTPIGTRCMRRDYGSRLFFLVDAPLNASTELAIIAETHQALATWEPDLDVTLTRVQKNQAGVTLNIQGRLRASGQPVEYEGIQL